MANKMLIDASHPEETRVVVVRGQKVEEFDFESANRKQLRGNIYLAKVTRVEPSLQAAFVEYGGNRHGFLAFSEIHPDYYQIPVADRQALLEAEAEAQAEEEHEEERRSNRGRRRRSSQRRAQNDETVVSTEAEAGTEEGVEAAPEGLSSGAAEGTESLGETGPTEASEAAAPTEGAIPEEGAGEDALEAVEGSAHIEAPQADQEPEDTEARTTEDDTDADDEDESDEDEDDVEEHEIVEQLGGDDAIEDLPPRRRTPRKQYKIQEVIKRRQILLVQVVKEERGNKGAALTTYLSLAGRYSVLMPNTGRGGGISRKITNAADRKRLKEIAQELEVPDGMGIILRTAGASRTKPEIKRDYEYLMRLWESVRELTLKSAAPALVYEEGSLIKRAIRDLYNKDIDDVMVAGEDGYREAKDFMRMLMPSHAKLVQPYRDPQPLFAKFGVEAQLDAMFSNVVTLKSGGYLVINPTEALVSIDVNSGRSTREHNIEDTALRTNLEAAEEIARQLRLRDLAGLIVIDFIDMEEKRNNRAVEKKLNECLKNDRARIQVGRISPFGLLEMSRQRIRTGVLESSSIPCPHCAGTGFVRSTPSVALQVLRSIEETLIKNSGYNLVVRTRMEAAFYILNQKRIHLRELESRFGVAISIVADDTLQGHTTYAIDRGDPALKLEHKSAATGIQIDAIVPIDEPVEEDEVETEEETAEDIQAAGEERSEQGESEGDRRRRRRRRRRRGRDREAFAGADQGDESAEGDESEGESGDEEAEAQTSEAEAASAEAGESDEERGGRRRRRGRRGGRGRGRDETVEFAQEEGFVTPDQTEAAPASDEVAPAVAQSVTEAPKPVAEEERIVAPQQPVAEEPAAPAPVIPEPEPVAVVLTPPDPERPKRAGWWSKAKSVLSGS
ncbi:ribonuclease E [Microvirga lupini]|uniref:Ribonuclease E n=1 Tax=Microvirga lupini TaxID=420324 RepID=A0A7W4VLM6_9HYPH|nr:ribonuclease E/G [Microvirga lupini]MBB3019438.1 ribonuclease E [Microvirga lupini]